MTDVINQTPPAADPRVHICAKCGKTGATCGVGAQWFCWRKCTPADWPGRAG